MTYSYQPHTTSAVVLTYPFSFAGADPGYISVNDVSVETRESGQPEWVQLDQSGWNLTGSNQITLTQEIPAPGDEENNLRIRRVVQKDVPYATFPRGAMLDMLNLNRSFIQLLQALQEVLDGFLPPGFAFQQNINMNGHKLINLAPGSEPGDSANWDQWEDHEGRIDAIEEGLLDSDVVRTLPYYTTATGGENRWQLGIDFTSAHLYINGIYQHMLQGSFSITNNGFDFAEPLQPGDWVYALVGAGIALPDEYVTQEQLVSLGYLSESDASTTYLAQSDAIATYISKVDANTTYETKTHATSTYTTQTATGLLTTRVSNLELVTRKKKEVYYSGLSLVIPTAATNLINLIKGLTPASGGPLGGTFINTTSNKLNVYNDNTSVLFKINIVGSWTTASQARSMVLNFTGTQGNTLTVPRVDATTSDVVQFSTYFSVDAGGNMVTNGATPMINSNGSVFTATAILLTVEQTTAQTLISAV